MNKWLRVGDVLIQPDMLALKVEIMNDGEEYWLEFKGDENEIIAVSNKFDDYAKADRCLIRLHEDLTDPEISYIKLKD
jgi:hypothetical protein